MKPQRLNPMKADLTTLINCLREVIFSSLNCHKVGKIVSFDEMVNQTRALSRELFSIDYLRSQKKC